MIRYLTVMAWAVLFTQAPPGGGAREEVYGVYSALLSSADALILIESETLRYVAPTSGCVRAPQPESTDLAEIQADYETRKHEIPRLLPDFKLDKPYLMLETEEAQKFLKDALDSTPQIIRPGTSPPPNPNPLFPRARRVFRLGDVYFNRSRTIAAVYYTVSETPLDSTRGWRIFRKSVGGAWSQDPSWTTCGMRSGR
jgi:hypothetical protein